MKSAVFVFAALLLTLSNGALQLYGQTAPTAGTGTTSTSKQEEKETAETEELLGDQSLVYFRPRLAFKFNYKDKSDDTSISRFRIKGVYSFGPRKRFAVSGQFPVIVGATPSESTVGLGDVELQAGMIFQETKRFTQGAGIQLNVPTSSEPQLDRGATVFKAIYGNSLLITPRWFFDSTLTYAHSLSERSGATAYDEIEPEFTIGRNLRWFGLSLHSDNWYDWPTDVWGSNLKVTTSRGFGKPTRWIGSLYYEFPVSPSTRKSFHYNIGIDVIRYFGGME